MFTYSRSRYFPAAESADRFGIVGCGGCLNSDWLLDAYQHGIFPWPMEAISTEMLWWSPDPRAIFELDGLRISRRLARRVRSGTFQVTSDQDFGGVMRGCGTAQDRAGHTWVTPEMVAAYLQLHREGHAHSIEVWHAGALAGGTYGVAIGAVFAAESMFYRVRDASKVALVYLAAHLKRRGYTLWDVQQLTEHTASLGAIEIPRASYLRRLQAAIGLPVTFGTLDGELSPLE
jgi:leucyl/phenylalanyl-tRNA--protein transferase